LLLSQADVGWVGSGSTIDSFMLRDHADAQEIRSFELSRNSRAGSRNYCKRRWTCVTAMPRARSVIVA
jgi:hypothetical protein